MFRRERPQRGRYRQFTQFGVEVIGEAGIGGEVDCLTLAWEVMRALSLTSNVELQINSLGDKTSRLAYVGVLKAYLLGAYGELSEDSQRRVDAGHVLRVLDSKDAKDRRVIEGGPTPLIYDHLNPYSRRRFDAVRSALTALSIPFTVNPFLVRGLDYYTHTAFEILPTSTSSSPSAQSALLAGGRYDGLFALLGGKDRPAVGWALGIERVALMLEGKEETAEEGSIAVVGIPSDTGHKRVEEGSAVWLDVMSLAGDLRRAGLTVATALEQGSASKQFAWAAKSGISACVVVGETEVREGRVQVKELKTKRQEEVRRDELIGYMRRLSTAEVNTQDSS